MRADRLIAALLVLQARGQVTAADLAEELEVSVPTARRDLEALAAAGIPVYAQPGRGGGWALLGGARTGLSGLTAAEAQALFVLLGPATAPEVKSALRKLLHALPDPFKETAKAAAGAVVVDPLDWGAADADQPPLVALLQGAVVQRRVVDLVYAGRTPSRRMVKPWGTVQKGDHWYLVAGTPAGQRTFRLDRIRDATVTDQTFSRPAGFSLADSWRETVEVVEDRQTAVTATVCVPARHLAVLRDQFGRHCTTLGPAADGRLRVQVSAPTPLMIAQHLAGWGAAITVDDPPSVQAELARLGREIVASYGASTS